MKIADGNTLPALAVALAASWSGVLLNGQGPQGSQSVSDQALTGSAKGLMLGAIGGIGLYALHPKNSFGWQLAAFSAAGAFFINAYGPESLAALNTSTATAALPPTPAGTPAPTTA